MFTNIWYVAERSENITATPRKVRMLGRDFVLFRDAEGKAACLSDICSHRGASLSGGRCRGDGTVSCPYHGWRFNRDGQCTLIPSAADPNAVPPDTKVDAYPTVERYGLIWAFLGDEPDAAAPIFDMPEFDNPAYRMITHDEIWHCNYHRAIEIDLDYVHSHFVHGAWGEEARARPPHYAVEDFSDAGFGSHLIAKSQPNRGLWRFLRKEGRGVPSYLKFHTAGLARNVKVFIGGEGSNMHFSFYHFTTPIDDTHTQSRLMFFRAFMKAPFFDKTNRQRNLRAMVEDRRICEAIMPKAAPADRVFEVQAEHDHLVAAYQNILAGMRARGWQIDGRALADAERDNIALAIPCPARRRQPSGWRSRVVPRIAAAAVRSAAAE